MTCMNCGKEMRKRPYRVLTYPVTQEYDCTCGLVVDERDGEVSVCRQSKVKQSDIKKGTGS